jgi:hypothetical protein
MNRKFIIDEDTLRALNLLCFFEGYPGIHVPGREWFPIREVKNE